MEIYFWDSVHKCVRLVKSKKVDSVISNMLEEDGKCSKSKKKQFLN